MKRKKHRLLRRITAMVMAIGLLPTTVYAQMDVSGVEDIGDKWRKVVGHEYSSFDGPKSKAFKVKADYGFKLQATKNTKLTVTKGTKCSAPSTYEGVDLKLPSFLKDDYLWFKTADNAAGEIQVKRTNLKIYQYDSDHKTGKWVEVDLLRTITGIEKYQGQNGYVALGKGITSTAYVGLEEVKTRNVFYKTGTTTPITIKSNITLSDIDDSQYIGVKTDKVDGEYVSQDTKLKYDQRDGTSIYADGSKENHDSEAYTCAAFIYESNSFDYTFGRDIEKPTHQEQFIGSGQNMVDIPPVEPSKTISDSDEEKVTKNTARDLAESWTYQIEQPIAQGIPENFRFDSFIFKDNIEECLKIQEVKIFAENSNAETSDVTSWFNINQSNNKITATLKDPKSENFYKNTIYTMKVKVKMDVPENTTEIQLDALRKTWTEHGHYNETKTIITEKNQASVLIDGTNRVTNEVSTEIHLPGDPGLKVIKDVNRYEHQVKDKVHYTVKASNTNSKADTAYFIIRDTSLPEGLTLDFDSIQVDGIDQSNYSIIQTKNGWELHSKDDYALPYGTEITVSYDALATNASNGKIIDNTAYAIAAGVPTKHDSEQVYINSPKTDVTKSAPDKEYKNGDHVSYTLDFSNYNKGTFMRKLHWTDTIENDGVTIKPGTVAIMVNGKDVTKDLDVTYSDDGKSYTVKTNYALKNGTLPVAGKGLADYDSLNYIDKMKVTYQTTIEDPDLAGETIINRVVAPATKNTNGDLIRDDEEVPSGGGQATEEVKVKSPKIQIIKGSDKKIYNVGDTAHYVLNITQNKEDLVGKDLEIRDIFEKSGMKISNIKVLFNKKDITKTCEIAKDKDNQFIIKTHKDVGEDDKVVVSYDVLFEHYIPGDIMNTATAVCSNTPEDESENHIEITNIVPTLTIEKASDKDVYFVGETGKYKVIVSQITENAIAKNIVISDELQVEGAIIQGDTIQIVHDGKNITEDCKITVKENGYYIETGKDLKQNEKITVTYDVLFKEPSLAGKTIPNIAKATSDNAVAETDNTVKTPEPVQIGDSDIYIEKNCSPATGTVVKNGEEIIYYLIVTNKGEEVAENILVKDMIPNLTEYVEGGTLKEIDGQTYATWVIDRLEAGKSNILEFKVKVSETATEEDMIRNVALGKLMDDTKKDITEEDWKEGFTETEEVVHPLKPQWVETEHEVTVEAPITTEEQPTTTEQPVMPTEKEKKDTTTEGTTNPTSTDSTPDIAETDPGQNGSSAKTGQKSALPFVLLLGGALMAAGGIVIYLNRKNRD